MKIVLTRSMLPGDIQYIKNGLNKEIDGLYEFAVPEEFTEEGISKEVADADVLLGPYVTKNILENAKKLRLIQVPWTGMDTFNFDAVAGYDIPVCNTHSNADSVAELGMALTLDLLKKVSYHDRKMRNGNWNRDQKPLSLKSRMVAHQTVCILGCGNIGYRIAKLFKTFGANIIAVGGHEADDVISIRYEKCDMLKALSVADVAICTLPLIDSTKGLIDIEVLKGCKSGMLLINLSRAAVMDEDSVYQALTEGLIDGFASDVWWNAPKRGESESYPSTHNKFWELDNVIMSPHRAGFVEGCLPHLDEAITNLIHLAKDEPLISVVDVNKHY
ncbi:MAG: hypothetical protein J6C99_07210 [Lachnospiraceae bacterium]|nr:hypothetical protein [Lachnospiraceae bacterium]